MWERLGAIVLSVILLTCVISVRSSAEDVTDRQVTEVIRDGFYRFSDSIDISEFSVKPEELTGVLASIIKDDPYLFFVNGQMSYSYKPGGSVLSLKPSYHFVGEDAFEAWESCRTQVREIATEAKKYVSPYKKALYLHDRICLSFEYDDTLESDSLYSFFQTGKGTCQAYTHLYMAVLRECGIESHFVASDTIEHIWNYVRIDGEWYHADLTWDDSAVTVSGVSRRHFLCSDKVAAERGHRDWYSSVSVSCLSERFAESDFDGMLDADASPWDADGDGLLSLADVLILRRYLERGDIPVFSGDLDGDSEITHGDVALLRKKLLGED